MRYLSIVNLRLLLPLDMCARAQIHLSAGHLSRATWRIRGARGLLTLSIEVS